MEQSTKMSLKLLVDTKRQKVLFAEARKEFVDFLFHILSLPIGTIARLLTKKGGMAGSLGHLYRSVQSLNNDYFEENLDKNSVLKPSTAVRVPLLSLNDAPTTKNFYKCRIGSCDRNTVTDSKGIRCHCGRSMSKEMNYVAPNGSGDISTSSNIGNSGYVKGVVTYMVMDNLEVKPMSTISSIALINKFNVKDVSSLVEKDVQLGLTEGLAMLKASLDTQAVLTAVFLGTRSTRVV